MGPLRFCPHHLTALLKEKGPCLLKGNGASGSTEQPWGTLPSQCSVGGRAPGLTGMVLEYLSLLLGVGEARREVWVGRQTLPGGLASQAADIGEEGVGAAARALGWPFLHFQLGRPQTWAPHPFHLSPLHCSPSSAPAPHNLSTHPACTQLSQAPKRSAQGQLGGCCYVPTDTVGGLSLGRRDLSLLDPARLAPGRNIVKQKQAPTMLGSDLAGF